MFTRRATRDGLFASSAKVAAVAITARIVLTAFPGVIGQWRQIVVFLAVVSTVLGSFAAIGQTISSG